MIQTSRRSAVRGVVLGVLLLGACNGYAQDKYGTPVDLDLSASGGIFQTRLPFDVPFMFKGPATDIELILYRRVNVGKQPSASCNNDLAPRPRELAGLPPLRGAKPVPADGEWGVWRCPSGKCPQFLLPVARLQVNRYYCFQFMVARRLAEPDKPRPFVLSAIDGWMTTNLSVTNPTPTDLDPLRLGVLEAIRGVAAAENLVVLPESILGTAERFHAAFIDTLRRTLSALRDVAGIDKKLGEEARELTGRINKEWFNAPLTMDVFAKVEAQKEQQGMAGFAQAVAKARALSGAAMVTELQGMALEPGGGLTLASKTTSQQRHDARTRLETNVITPFEELRRLFVKIQNDAAFRKTLALTDAIAADAGRISQAIAEHLAVLRLTSAEIEASEDALERKETAATQLALAITLAEGVNTLGNTVGDFDTRATWYFALDVGLAVAPKLDTMFPYVGMNIYFTPVNKEAPVSTVGPLKRFAAMIGVTYATEPEKIKLSDFTEPVLAERTFLVGAGYRILDSLRVTAGGLVLREKNRNPTVDDHRLVLTPFVSLSFDWNIKDDFFDKLFEPDSDN
jgi:hypothetical protein